MPRQRWLILLFSIGRISHEPAESLDSGRRDSRNPSLILADLRCYRLRRSVELRSIAFEYSMPVLNPQI
jgi:hypothetical protein